MDGGKSQMANTKFDICIPTLNCGMTLGSCLDMIELLIPINRIIICDGGSTDDTLNIAKEHKCQIIYEQGSLGKARQRLIEAVETSWFLFIDADILINEKWWNKISDYMYIGFDMGAVNGYALTPGILNITRRIIILIKKLFKIKQRGFTSNTLIMTDAVKGIKVPDIKRLEDMAIQDEVIKRGYKWEFADAYCKHLKSTKQVLKEAFSDGKTLLKKEGLKGVFKL